MSNKTRTKKNKDQDARRMVFDFDCKSSEGSDVFIEGFANRAMKEGGKVIDRGMEHIPSGEWAIEEWKANPIIFFNHDRDMPIGQGVGAKVTPDGLWIKAKISNSKDPEISRVRDLIKEGILRTFSVGIDVEDEEISQDDKSITLKGVNLLETSVVTIPMNQESFFSVSKSMLKKDNFDQLAAKILKAKGAWVAAAIHQQIYEMQAQDPEFSRADALTSIAGGSEISQGELMEMMAGNTAIFPEAVLELVATVLGMDLEALAGLNDADLSLTDADASLNAVEEVEDEELEEEGEEEEEEESEAAEQDEDEELAESEDEEEAPSEEEPEQDEDEELGFGEEEEPEDEEEKQAEQGVDVSGPEDPGEPTKLPMVGEVEDAADMTDEIESETPESGASSKEAEDTSEEDEEGNAFQSCVSSKVRKLLDEGKPQDQALAIAISACGEGKECTPMDAKAWEQVLADIEAWKKEKEEAKKKAEGDGSNGAGTLPLNTTEQIDLDLGQPAIAAAQQTNILLGQVVAELQKNNKLVSEMISMKVSEAVPKAEDTDEEQSEDEELTDSEEDSSQDDSSKDLDIVQGYREKLNEKLVKFGV